jgi:cytochrome c oxidase subunit 1
VGPLAAEDGRLSSVAVRGRSRPGLVRALLGTDHKQLGFLLIAMSLFFFCVGGVLALFMRTELAQPGMQVMSRDTYDQLFTMHGTTMIYLFVMPIALALGVYLVPLQIGARRISRPRVALTGAWIWFAGGLTMYSGFLTQDGAGRAGWFAYWPLSGSQGTPGNGQSLWTLGIIMAGIGTFLIGACLLGTILRRRAPGMTMLRMPVFTWSVLASVLMVVTAWPSLLLAMTLLYLDRHGAEIFNGYGGAVDYQHLFWFFGHPVVYEMFFPFLGAAAEVIAVCSHKRFFGYRPLTISLLAFAALSMSVWAHHMFTTGGVLNQYFSFTSTMLIIPAGIEYFDMVGTMIGGSIVMRTSMLFALGFLLQFLVGGLSGVFVASPTLDYHAQDSYIVVAHFHYTLMAGSVFGLFAGLYHWWPKFTGWKLREGLGKLHFALMLVGTNLTFFPMFFLGQEGMTRRIATYPASTGWGTLNTIETAGSFVIGLGVLVFLWNVVVSRRTSLAAGPDPWGGHTLEWATSSPPPPENFDAPLPPIRTHAPLLDLRMGETEAPVDTTLSGAPA